MKRILGHGLKLVAIAVLCAAVAPACVDNDMSLFVRNALAPPQNRQNNVCLYQPDPAAAFTSEGVLDTAVRDNYVINLLVGNQNIGRGDQANGRAESNRIHITGAVVTVTNPDGSTVNSFTATTSGFVDVGTNNVPGFGIAAVTALDAPSVARIGTGLGTGQTKLILANIKVFGKTLGGVDVESGEFQFPIRACNGCLISFATGDDLTSPGVDCNLPLDSGGTGSTTVLPCNVGQDEVTPCQLCTDRTACRSRATP